MRKYIPFVLLKQGEQFYTVRNDGTVGTKCIRIGMYEGGPLLVLDNGNTINAVTLEPQGTHVAPGTAVWCAENEAVIRESDLSDSNKPEDKSGLQNVARDIMLNRHIAVPLNAEEVYENLAVWYTPDAIKSHFESGMYHDWVDKATFEELLDVGRSILDSDTTWSDFHDHIIMAIDVKMREAEEAKHRKRIEEEGR